MCIVARRRRYQTVYNNYHVLRIIETDYRVLFLMPPESLKFSYFRQSDVYETLVSTVFDYENCKS